MTWLDVEQSSNAGPMWKEGSQIIYFLLKLITIVNSN